MATTIPVWDTLVESWEKTHGVKGSFWAAFGIIMAIAIGFSILEGLIPVVATLISLVSSLVMLLLRTGTVYMGIMRARNQPVEYQQVFRAMRIKLAMKVAIVYVLQGLVTLPFVAIVAIGVILMATNTILGAIIGIIGFAAAIYISVRVAFGMCYVIDKETGGWESIKLSYAATRNHVWALIGTFLLFACLFAISIIPLGIGLIWTLPCSMVLYGILYQKLLTP